MNNYLHKDKDTKKENTNSVRWKSGKPTNYVFLEYSQHDEEFDKLISRSISRVIDAMLHIMILNYFSKVIDIGILNPFKSKVISLFVVFNILQAPSIYEKEDDPNSKPEDVNKLISKFVVFINEGIGQEVKLVSN